jgi:hypothetical protein
MLHHKVWPLTWWLQRVLDAIGVISVFHPNRLILAQRSHKGNTKRLRPMGDVWWTAQHDNVTFTCEFSKFQAFCLTFVSIQQQNERFPFCWLWKLNKTVELPEKYFRLHPATEMILRCATWWCIVQQLFILSGPRKYKHLWHEIARGTHENLSSDYTPLLLR